MGAVLGGGSVLRGAVLGGGGQLYCLNTNIYVDYPVSKSRLSSDSQ